MGEADKVVESEPEDGIFTASLTEEESIQKQFATPLGMSFA